MPPHSAGLLAHRIVAGVPEVLIGHMGGPFWAAKDSGAWSIPKGEIAEGEDPETAARREFTEETGFAVPVARLAFVAEVVQGRGKRVTVFTCPMNVDPTLAVSNTFTMEWPPKSGQMREFPEIDRLEWMDLDTAASKLVAGQVAAVEALRMML